MIRRLIVLLLIVGCVFSQIGFRRDLKWKDEDSVTTLSKPTLEDKYKSSQKNIFTDEQLQFINDQKDIIKSEIIKIMNLDADSTITEGFKTAYNSSTSEYQSYKKLLDAGLYESAVKYEHLLPTISIPYRNAKKNVWNKIFKKDNESSNVIESKKYTKEDLINIYGSETQLIINDIDINGDYNNICYIENITLFYNNFGAISIICEDDLQESTTTNYNITYDIKFEPYYGYYYEECISSWDCGAREIGMVIAAQNVIEPIYTVKLLLKTNSKEFNLSINNIIFEDDSFKEVSKLIQDLNKKSKKFIELTEFYKEKVSPLENCVNGVLRYNYIKKKGKFTFSNDCVSSFFENIEVKENGEIIYK